MLTTSTFRQMLRLSCCQRTFAAKTTDVVGGGEWRRRRLQLQEPSLRLTGFTRHMAGHSKWQNIRHVKAANDAAKSKLFAKYSRMMKVAIREGQSNDPRFNIRLSHVLEMARRANMPTSTIENVLKEKEVSKELLVPFLFEVKGPGGCFLILEGLTDNLNRTKHNIRSYVKKVGASVIDSGARHAFDYKGLINVARLPDLTLEKVTDIAIEVGAEDVVEVTEEDGSEVFQFSCEADDFYSVKKNIVELNLQIVTSGLEYLPVRLAQLSEPDRNLVAKLADILDDDPDIVRCYDNIVLE